MASRSFHALFLSASDQLADAGRWIYLTVLGLAVLHAAVVMPFIENSRLESETTSEIDRLATVDRGLGEIRNALQVLRQEVPANLSPVLDHLADDLASDLERLTATRRRIAEQAAAELAAESEVEGSEPIVPPPPEPPVQVLPFELDDPDWVADLRDVTGRDETLAALTPIVEQLIVQPRYFDLEQSWRHDTLPRLEARLDAAASAMPRLRGRFPEARETWDSFAGSLSHLTRTVRELRLTPPPQPFLVDGPVDHRSAGRARPDFDDSRRHPPPDRSHRARSCHGLDSGKLRPRH